MANLKKYTAFLKLFVIFLTFVFQISCSPKHYQLNRIEGKLLPVTEKSATTPAIDDYLAPYREHINKDLNNVLSFSPETLDKSTGKWQTPLGNFIADMTFKLGEPLFKARENKEISICLLNNGGIRAILPKGNVTARTAFEIMPFENKLIIVALKGEQIQEMIEYIIKQQKPHPLSGLTFTITKDKKAKNILIQGQALDQTKTYYVATNDYLSNGGDSMNFFLKNTGKYDLDYKLRNLFIDYLKKNDTILAPKNIRITEE